MGFKKEIIVFIVALFIGVNTAKAQVVENGERQGLLQATASIYPVQQLNVSGLNIYLGGYGNYYFDDKYSFRGDIFQYIGAQKKPGYLKNNTVIQAGFMRYFPMKRFDPYIGVQVGASIIETNERVGERVINSLFALKAGLNFHVYKYFYFFAELQYTHQPDPWHSRPYDTFTGTGGLGFQLPCYSLAKKNVKKSHLLRPC
ncbi:MAG TPA: hypothetical protein PLP27_09865 [Crocinitomicaceae bacterium]|nr:hypothetical protein [Crocinitomicaceae bacterium]